MNINFTIQGRDLSFQMDHDPSFVACANTKLFLDRYGACEPEVMHAMVRILRPGDYAIDGGANIGFFTLLMVQVVGPKGRVLACEPGSNNIPVLEANIKLNALTNVEIEKRPLWNRNGTYLDFYLSEDSGVNSLTVPPLHTGHERLDSTTLSTHMRPTPRLVKLDIEGSELQALMGARPFLKQVPFVICELNETALVAMGTSRPAVRKFMRDYRFETFLLQNDGNIPLLIPPKTEIVSERLNLNVLFSTIEHVAEVWPSVEITSG